jgi:hypothetical protein
MATSLLQNAAGRGPCEPSTSMPVAQLLLVGMSGLVPACLPAKHPPFRPPAWLGSTPQRDYWHALAAVCHTHVVLQVVGGHSFYQGLTTTCSTIASRSPPCAGLLQVTCSTWFAKATRPYAASPHATQGPTCLTGTRSNTRGGWARNMLQHGTLVAYTQPYSGARNNWFTPAPAGTRHNQPLPPESCQQRLPERYCKRTACCLPLQPRAALSNILDTPLASCGQAHCCTACNRSGCGAARWQQNALQRVAISPMPHTTPGPLKPTGGPSPANVHPCVHQPCLAEPSRG